MAESSTVLQKTQSFVENTLQMPMLSKLVPGSNDAWIFLLGSGILGRMAVGGTRIAADTPILNTRSDQSEDAKTKTWVERIFMEAIGVVAGFASIHIGQDLAAKAVESVDKSTHPSRLLATLHGHLPQHSETLSNVSRAFLASYMNPTELKQWLGADTVQGGKASVLKALKHLSPQEVQKRLVQLESILSVNLYGAGKINHIEANFKALEGKGFQEAFAQSPKALNSIHSYFASNNIKTNFFVITGGLAASTYFSGILWQQINDGFIRKKVSPVVTRWVKPLFFSDARGDANAQGFTLTETSENQPLSIQDKQLSDSLIRPPSVYQVASPTLQFAKIDALGSLGESLTKPELKTTQVQTAPPLDALKKPNPPLLQAGRSSATVSLFSL